MWLLAKVGHNLLIHAIQQVLGIDSRVVQCIPSKWAILSAIHYPFFHQHGCLCPAYANVNTCVKSYFDARSTAAIFLLVCIQGYFRKQSLSHTSLVSLVSWSPSLHTPSV